MRQVLFRLALPLIIIIASFIYSALVGIIVLLCFIALVLYFGRSMIYFMRGRYYAGKSDEVASLQWLKKAHLTAPHNINFAITYGYQLLRKEEIELADSIFSKIPDQGLTGENEINLKLNRSIVLWKLGRPEESIVLAEEIYEKYKNTVIYGTLGYYYLLHGDLDLALQINEEAYEFNNSNNAILDNLGLTYYKLGRYDEAMVMFEKLVQANPTFREAYYNMGLLYEHNNNWQRAYEFYKRSLDYKPALVTHVTLQEIEAKIAYIEANHPPEIKGESDANEQALDS